MDLRIKGLEAFDQLINRTIVGSRHGLRDAGEIVISSIQANFEERGARGGETEWEPVPVNWLAKRQTWPTDIQAQLAYIRDHYPLRDTRAMENSLRYTDEEDSAGNIRGYVDPTASYAVDHELGVPGEIRRRPFMHITDEDEALAVAAVQERLMEAVNG